MDEHHNLQELYHTYERMSTTPRTSSPNTEATIHIMQRTATYSNIQQQQ